jgi:NIMA (never in mitosis gene a)-related kinase
MKKVKLGKLSEREK